MIQPPASRNRRARAFTLLEVALIVAIIGMMMLMLIGYIMAPKNEGPLPPVEARKLIPGTTTPAPNAPTATPVPEPSATPAKTIELPPPATPAFR